MTKSSFIVVYANMYFSIIRLEICVLYFRIKNRQTFTIPKNQVKNCWSFLNSVRRLSHQPISQSPPRLSLSTFLAIPYTRASLISDLTIPSRPLSINFSRYPLPTSFYILFSLSPPGLSLSTFLLSPPHLSLSTYLPIPSPPLSLSKT